eukprot:6912148-Pyramimonas_sp.AAC.1
MLAGPKGRSGRKWGARHRVRKGEGKLGVLTSPLPLLVLGGPVKSNEVLRCLLFRVARDTTLSLANHTDPLPCTCNVRDVGHVRAKRTGVEVSLRFPREDTHFDRHLDGQGAGVLHGVEEDGRDLAADADAAGALVRHVRDVVAHVPQDGVGGGFTARARAHHVAHVRQREPLLLQLFDLRARTPSSATQSVNQSGSQSTRASQSRSETSQTSSDQPRLARRSVGEWVGEWVGGSVGPQVGSTGRHTQRLAPLYAANDGR